jgi:hypothetical protein
VNGAQRACLYAIRSHSNIIYEMTHFHSRGIFRPQRLCHSTNSIVADGCAEMYEYKFIYKPEVRLWCLVENSSGSEALCWTLTAFSFLILHKVTRTPWKGDHPVASPLPTHRINAQRHLCLEWDSNPRSQCSSGRRLFIP